jgi:putative FmdB family regulatory protein
VPTYGYRCKQCDTEWDIFQRMADDPVAACPECGGEGRRLIYPVGVVFKGSGFYKTDSRSGGSSGGGGGGGGGSGSGSGSDSPAIKPDSAKGDSAKPESSAAGETASGSKDAGTGRPGAAGESK